MEEVKDNKKIRIDSENHWDNQWDSYRFYLTKNSSEY